MNIHWMILFAVLIERASPQPLWADALRTIFTRTSNPKQEIIYERIVSDKNEVTHRALLAVNRDISKNQMKLSNLSDRTLSPKLVTTTRIGYFESPEAETTVIRNVMLNAGEAKTLRLRQLGSVKIFEVERWAGGLPSRTRNSLDQIKRETYQDAQRFPRF
ncbi:hypothetical protein MJO28_004908 [Puccinia striiformis f. sp. tritici]|uniref:Uncharacterized protein n=2 Tax=Puccinia striiformis TaxID=27350 RepID=A0ACC0EL23_9BASI|nr:hypothetical protein MJO28_004908 [Puccinia striiformis f. sp. tritici]KAI7959921.1 hypothetical protein MJO29_004989 [Puccinia striiformis f. sp. tritici]KAI9609468.1 hypothetical protein H4Q26_007424 [Puccinia striiformis f. sp. tritici PST-130]